MPNLENELERYKRENKNIRDTINKKLQLEEEVFHLKSKLKKYECFLEDNVALNTQNKILGMDMDKLRQNNERLQMRKDQVEILLEHSSITSAYNLDKYKV